jgi:putative nucleotidyltransferase with HDIG domain
MNLLDNILKSTIQLPPFPAVIQKVLQLIDDPNSSARGVVDVIQYDQAITANVLKVCNSAFFGARRPIHTLREALVRIGFNELMEIILSRSSLQFISKACPGYGLEKGDLWRHSVSCALLSQILAKRIHEEPSPILFTAGLLHDIGKVLLSDYVQDNFEAIKRNVLEEGHSFSEAEKLVLGINHAELGGIICERWQFPKIIVSVIRYHHAPSSASEDQKIVQRIYLCDLVALMTGIGGGADGLYYHADNEIIGKFKLDERDIEQFVVQLDKELEDVESMLAIQ